MDPRSKRGREKQPVDERFIRAVVAALKSTDWPAVEGYYLVVITPDEGRELRVRLATKGVACKPRFKHPPTALTSSAVRQGFEVVCVLHDALVVTIDHAEDPRCTNKDAPVPVIRHLHLVKKTGD